MKSTQEATEDVEKDMAKATEEEEKAQAKADALQANQLRDLEASPLTIVPMSKSPARQHRSASAA